MLGLLVMASPRMAGVNVISVLFRLMSLFGVRLSQKLFRRSGSSIYMVIKFSRCISLTSVMRCFTTLGPMILYECAVVRSLFSIITPSPKSRLIDLISVLVIHCNVVVNDTGVLPVLFIVGVFIELP